MSKRRWLWPRSWTNEVRPTIEIGKPELFDAFFVGVDALSRAKEKVFLIHSFPDVAWRFKAGFKPSQDLVSGYFRNLSRPNLIF
jgi:hypothetical protein